MKLRHFVSMLVFAQAAIADITQAATPPLTIDGEGPGALTSRWHIVDPSSSSVNYFGVGHGSPCKPALYSGTNLVKSNCSSIATEVFGIIHNSQLINYVLPDGTAAVSGKTVKGPPTSIAGLDVSSQLTVIDGPGLLRGLATLHNPSNSSITVETRLLHNLSSQATVAASSDGDTDFATSDRWIIASGGSSLTVDTLVFYGDGSPEVVSHQVDRLNDIYAQRFNVTVPPGETRNVLWFHAMNQIVADATSAVSQFDDIDVAGELLQGLSRQQLINTVNWDFSGIRTSFIFERVVDVTTDLCDPAFDAQRAYINYKYPYQDLDWVDGGRDMGVRVACYRNDDDISAYQLPLLATTGGNPPEVIADSRYTYDRNTGARTRSGTEIENPAASDEVLEGYDWRGGEFEDGAAVFWGCSRAPSGFRDCGVLEADPQGVRYLARRSEFNEQYKRHRGWWVVRDGHTRYFQALIDHSYEYNFPIYTRSVTYALFQHTNDALTELVRYGSEYEYNYETREYSQRTVPGADFYSISLPVVDNGKVAFAGYHYDSSVDTRTRISLNQFENDAISVIWQPGITLPGQRLDDEVYGIYPRSVKNDVLTFEALFYQEDSTGRRHFVARRFYTYDNTDFEQALPDRITVANEAGQVFGVHPQDIEDRKFASSLNRVVDYDSTTRRYTREGGLATNLDGTNRLVTNPNLEGTDHWFYPPEFGDQTIGYGGAQFDAATSQFFQFIELALLDTDSDGVADVDDNCPVTPNPGQEDTTAPIGEGPGDACRDTDGDEVLDVDDFCPLVPDPSNIDSDSDRFGDVCDNCPFVRNTDQADTDGDGQGDVCDADDDNDGIMDTADNCPLIDNPTQDNIDGDAFGDVCDGDKDGDGLFNDIDGRIDAATGEFIDESATPSANFTDQHQGGISFGDVGGGSLEFTIEDLQGETDCTRTAGRCPVGFRVVGIASEDNNPNQQVKRILNICDWKRNEGGKLEIYVGTDAEISCGSVTLRSVVGTPPALFAAEDAVVIVPPAASMTAEDKGVGAFSLDTPPDNAAPVTVQLGEDTVVSIPALVSSAVEEIAPGQFVVQNDEASDAPLTVNVENEVIEYQPGEEGVGIMIDIKPNEEPNALNLGSNGNVPVAILSTASFDATSVVPTSVTLAGSGVKLKGNGDAQASIKDVNNDGLNDLLVHVNTEALELTDEAVSAELVAELTDGTPVRGSDSVLVVP